MPVSGLSRLVFGQRSVAVLEVERVLMGCRFGWRCWLDRWGGV